MSRVDWDKVPLRNEDPCTQVEEFFHQKGVQGDLLTKMLGGLSRQGFQDIEYEVENEPDVHQEETFLVTAWRRICVCASKDTDIGQQVSLEQEPKPKKKRKSAADKTAQDKA